MDTSNPGREDILNSVSIAEDVFLDVPLELKACMCSRSIAVPRCVGQLGNMIAPFLSQWPRRLDRTPVEDILNSVSIPEARRSSSSSLVSGVDDDEDDDDSCAALFPFA